MIVRAHNETAYAARQRREGVLYLDSNEGGLPAEECVEILRSFPANDLRRYPDATALECQLASRFEIEPRQTIVTAGADDALDRICRALLSPGGSAIATRPTFEMIGRYVRLAGGDLVEHRWLDGGFPTEAITRSVDSTTRAIFVVTPNNPTGAVVSQQDLLRLSRAAPHAALVIDLAYTEFADHDLTHFALTLPNAVVIRTFSKAWGLAGLRLGFAMGHADMIAWMRASGQPYAASAFSIFVAQQWLNSGRHAAAAYADQIRRRRQELTRLLCDCGANVLDSQANFVLAKFANAEHVANRLLAKGVSVRRFGQPLDLRTFLRITCPGSRAEFNQLCAALCSVCGES